MSESSVPVSYTHLMVIVGGADESVVGNVHQFPQLFDAGDDLIHIFPVSYTHLDVYKRQLATQPEMLLCDEPTSALDPLTTKSMLALLTDINKKCSLSFVERICGR